MTPGDRFGYLVILRESSRASNYGRRYVCLCACGTETTQRWQDLRSGAVVSCGCVGKLGRQAANNARRIRAEHQAQMQAERRLDAESLGVLYSFARAA
jgi:hypothetical protein